MTTKAIPPVEQPVKAIPSTDQPIKPLPDVKNAENCVRIGGELIEIKATKLKYMRNRTALFYKYVETVPLPDIFGMKAGTFGDDRDGDKAVMDWLIAVFDDENLVTKHYDEIDSDMIYRILAIFKRLTRISEMEDRLKNVAKNLTQEVD